MAFGSWAEKGSLSLLLKAQQLQSLHKDFLSASGAVSLGHSNPSVEMQVGLQFIMRPVLVVLPSEGVLHVSLWEGTVNLHELIPLTRGVNEMLSTWNMSIFMFWCKLIVKHCSLGNEAPFPLEVTHHWLMMPSPKQRLFLLNVYERRHKDTHPDQTWCCSGTAEACWKKPKSNQVFLSAELQLCFISSAFGESLSEFNKLPVPMCSTLSPGKCPLSCERKGGERNTPKWKGAYSWIAAEIRFQEF